jgi:hypothetical protein
MAPDESAGILADTSDSPLDGGLTSVAAAPGAATTLPLPKPTRSRVTGGGFAETGSRVQAGMSATSVPPGALRATLGFGPPEGACANGCFDAGALAIIAYGGHGGASPRDAGFQQPEPFPVRGSSAGASASSAGSAGGALLGLVCALSLMAGRRWWRLLLPPEAWRATSSLALPERPG